MKTSHITIHAAKMLYATFFTATLVTSCTLQAMERPYKRGEQTAQSKEMITLQCSDRTIFKVRYEIVIQSKTIKKFIDDAGEDNTYAPIRIANSISSKTMTDMIDYMEFVTHAQAEHYPRRNIILKLMEIISESCTDQTLLDYIQAATNLNFKVLLRALSIVLAQRLDPVSGITDFRLNDMCYGVYKSLQKASYLYYNKQLDVDKPVAIELNDLVDFGILDDDALLLNDKLEKCIIHLITPSQYQALQSVLDVLSKHSNSLSIKAHEVLVAHVRTLTKEQIKKLFETLKDHGESILKMALRLVYAKDHNEDLDNLKCVDFFDNINKWVNGDHFRGTTQLLSKTYLQYVLPLIEPVTKTLVRELNLADNKLASLPNSIGNLVNLKELNLYNNQLTSLPDSIGNLINVKKLDLVFNELTSLPDAIGNLVNLEELNLTCNQLTSLPDSIGNLVNLKELNLYNNQLTSLPDSINNLKSLTYLNLTNNQLASLPDSIGNLVNLKGLNLTNNQLTSLPNSVGNLSKLEWLDLTNNQLASLPDSIGNLVSLEELDLSKNQLTSLPDSIGNLVNLRWLDLTKNQLTSLPDSIGSLVNLKRLVLYKNLIPDDIKQALKQKFEHLDI